LRPVAFYTQKAQGIIAISDYLCTHYAGDAAAMLAQPPAPLREELLALPRIGPETADVILLYAGKHPVFVVDEYTRRMLERVDPLWQSGPYGATPEWSRKRYALLQERLQRELHHLPDDDLAVATLQQFYADYHALINELCVRYCLARRPRCSGPPARRIYSRQAGRNAYLERNDGCPLREVCAFYRAQQAGGGAGL
jgi:endonuclease-3 related protein